MEQITAFEWMTLGLGAFGFLSTWTGGIIGFFKIVHNIKDDTDKKIDEKVTELLVTFREEQKSQDHRFGEVGAAMRQKISDVEKEMHQIEIWGRDNYVQKPEIENVRKDIRELARSIKEDFKDLKAEIAAKN